MDFPSSAYGSSSGTPIPYKTELYRLSNQTYYGKIEGAYVPWVHNRGPKTSNPLTRIGNTSTQWRRPSVYERKCYVHSVISPGQFKVGSGVSYFTKNGILVPSNLYNAALAYSPLQEYVGGTFLSPSTSVPHYVNGKAKATTRALSDLASAKANLAENAAQMGRTLDSIADIASDVVKIGRALNGLRKGQLRQILNLNVRELKYLVRKGKVSKRVANYWLAYWYGFKPLYSDSVGLFEVLRDLSEPALLVHGRGRSSWSKTQVWKAPPTNNFTDPATMMMEEVKLEFECNLTGRFFLNGQHIRALNRLGLLNPLSLAWELVPFSFVFDWIVPVGETLQTFSATRGLRFQGGHITSRYSRVLMATVAPSHQMGSSMAMTRIESKAIDRQALLDFPIGEFYEKTFFTGASRWATIGALLRGLVKVPF